MPNPQANSAKTRLNRYLPRYQRLFWMALNLFLGQIPALLFFIWVERNATLPFDWLAPQFPDPWESASAWNLAGNALWNIALILTFGAIHSGTAQPVFTRLIEKIFPVQTIRTVYWVITGCTILLVIHHWKNTGIVLWALPGRPLLIQILSLLTFGSLMAFTAKVLKSMGPLDFTGWKQLYSTPAQLQTESTTPSLQRTGLFGRVRHPIYAFTLLAFTLAPIMTLDRALIVLGSVLYLAWGIPLEERKLIAQFGDAYRQYRKEVPAIIPKLGQS
jgi:hypothetical protein